MMKKWRLATALATCGADASSRMILFVFPFWLPIKKRLGFGDRTNRVIRLSRFGEVRPFRLLENLDFVPLREVFVDGDYSAAEALEIPDRGVVFDLGSNIGVSLIYFDMCFHGRAAVFGFEPNPALQERLEEVSRTCKSVRVFPFAAGAEDGERTFHIHPGNLSSSFTARSAGEATLVPTRSLDSLLTLADVSHVHLMKFDIEGAEYEVFAGSPSLGRIGMLIGEVHYDLFPHTRDEFRALLSGWEVDEREITEVRSLLHAVPRRHSSL